MTKVLVFGTYDIFHKGHEHHLTEAKKFGDELFVVVGRNKTVEILKGKKPKNSEQHRLKVLNNLSYVTKAVLGNLDDKYKVIEEIKPDFICLGYDQKFFVDKLKEELKKRNINAKIIKFEEGHKTHIYKSSKLR